MKSLVVIVTAPARYIAALPLVVFGRKFRGQELAHEETGIRLAHRRREHLHISVEFRVSIRIRDVGRKIHRCRHRLELYFDTRLLTGLFDDRLSLLPRRVDRALEDELQLLAVLDADAIRAALPTGFVQHLVGLVDTELPFRVLRSEARRVV